MKEILRDSMSHVTVSCKQWYPEDSTPIKTIGILANMFPE